MITPRKVLALDLGTTTGWAWSSNGSPVAHFSGTWDLKPGRFEGGGMRFVRFAKLLDELAETAVPGAVYFEEVRRHAGTSAAHVYGGLMATLTAWCEAREIPYAAIPVGTIKRRATGKGNASKSAMVEAANVQWPGHGFVEKDHDRVDALWVLQCGLDMLEGVAP